MNLVADEGVERLRDEGHAVLYVAEMDPGTSDDAVLDLANARAAPLF